MCPKIVQKYVERSFTLQKSAVAQLNYSTIESIESSAIAVTKSQEELNIAD